MQRWCNIPCLIRCNIFASTAFSCMFKMFFEIWGGDAVTWVSGGVVMLSVLNTKCFIYSSYEILHSDRSKHIFIRESVVCRCYNINDYTATMLLLFILEICCWQTGVFQGRFSFFHPTYRQNESQVDESSFQISNSMSELLTVNGRIFIFPSGYMKMCFVGFCRHNNMDIETGVYNFLSGVLW